jgi:hypothetical protein
MLPYEDRVILAIEATKEDASLSERRATAINNVRRSTLYKRRAGTTSQRNSQANSSTLTKYKEDTLVQCIRKLDARGFAPTLGYVREMAN